MPQSSTALRLKLNLFGDTGSCINAKGAVSTEAVLFSLVDKDILKNFTRTSGHTWVMGELQLVAESPSLGVLNVLKSTSLIIPLSVTKGKEV